MSTAPEGRDELDDLLGAVRDGELTDEQAARLDRRLADDPDARSYYLEYLNLCATLRHYQGHPGSKASPAGEGPVPPPPPSSTSRPPKGLGPTWSRRWTWLSAAAALLVASGLAVRFWPVGGGATSVGNGVGVGVTVGADRAAGAGPSGGIALVVKVDAATWDPEDGPRPAAGMVLKPGRFRLASGHATLAFFSGVTLTLEAPADLDMIAVDRIYCRRGKLRARVPAGAEGFVVESPGSAVIDLGTEFALNVEPDGRSRVMVFEGKAEAALLDTAGAIKQGQIVGRSKSYDIDARAGQITETGPESDGFVAPRGVGVPRLVLDPGYADAIMASRPRGYWRFESMAGGVVPDEVPGAPALRAGGPVRLADDSGPNHCALFRAAAPEQFLATDEPWELPGEPGHAVEFWFLSEGIRYASIVGLYPPTALTPPGQDSPFVHTFLVEQTAEARRLHKPASIRFMHRWPIDIKMQFNVYSYPVYMPRRWHHVVAQKHGGRIELYFDGIPAPPLTLKPDHPTVSCHLVVGRRTPESLNPSDDRPFVGRLDELVIYDHPLSAREVLEHFQLASQEHRPE